MSLYKKDSVGATAFSITTLSITMFSIKAINTTVKDVAFSMTILSTKAISKTMKYVTLSIVFQNKGN